MDEIKLETKKQWGLHPCGIRAVDPDIEYGSFGFFESLRHRRYQLEDRWIPAVIDFSSAERKKLLEIGYGMGFDLLTFRQHGAEVYGIDLVEEHFRLAKRNFEVHQEDGVLKIGDAAQIDFPSEFFDIVYSNGVLHHTPDTVRCISEAYRVLKPGGQLILCLYHTYSAFHLLYKLLYEGLLHHRLRKLGYRGLMATVEHGADGVQIKPLVKTYSQRQLQHILEDFASVHFRITHFRTEHIPVMGKIIPRSLEKYLEPVLGWYVVAFATK